MTCLPALSCCGKEIQYVAAAAATFTVGAVCKKLVVTVSSNTMQAQVSKDDSKTAGN